MNNMRYDVTALGEILIDFTPTGTTAAGAPCFESNPGGAPANVLISVSRLGGKTAFIGKAGRDFFGDMLKETLEKNGVNADGFAFSDDVRTTLAFVTLDKTGNRSFSFFRNPGADFMLAVADVPLSVIENSSIFHFGSLSLTHEPARAATHHAIVQAKAAGCLISYDPNLRLSLWPDVAMARREITACLQHADILKISEEEFTFLTGQTDYVTHAPAFAAAHGITCLFVTLGAKGAFYHYNGMQATLPTYDVPILDTTGSGDAFMGAVLAQLSRRPSGLAGLTRAELEGIVAFANASGAIAAKTKGAIPAIPDRAQVEACMQRYPLLA